MAEKPAETIQTLLQAEEAAKEVIDKARKQRDVRLKEAAKEAETEIKKFREDKEAQYQANVQKYAGSSGDATEKIAADTKRQIKATEAHSRQNKAPVVEKLVEFVTTIDADLSKE